MKTLTIYSKIIFILFVLVNINACKKDDSVTTPTPTVTKLCKVSKIDYGRGEYDVFTYNSSGQVTKIDRGYLDYNTLKIATTTRTFAYDVDGLLINKLYDDGSRNQEKFTYINGALSTMEYTDKTYFLNVKVNVTTDANKKIIAMKENFGLKSIKIIRDAQDNISKIEDYDKNNILQSVLEFSNYDGKKTWQNGIPTWIFDATKSVFGDLDYLVLSGQPSGTAKSIKYYSVSSGKSTLESDITSTQMYNSNGFATQSILTDALDKSYKQTYNYSYSDCQ